MIDLESYIKLDNDIKQRPIVFQGTHAEWEALTSTHKAHYQYIAFTDDTGSPEVVDSVPTQNSTNLVQSGGVWSGLNTVNKNFGTVELSSVAAYPHSVGELFINSAGQMVKCTAAIAIGDTITIGTNATRTNVAIDLNDFKYNTMKRLEYTSITDLNDMPLNSYIIIPGSNIANQPPNAGDIRYGDAAVILYFYCGGSYLVQLYFNTKGVSAIRTCLAGSWGNWISL